jgi:hypothetical protein
MGPGKRGLGSRVVREAGAAAAGALSGGGARRMYATP